MELSPRALLTLLANGTKAVDVVQTALRLGLLDELAAGPVRLAELSSRLDVLPGRLAKLLDCLESLGFVYRDPAAVPETRYLLAPGVREAAEAVVGQDGIETDRDAYPWRRLYGRLADVLRGRVSVPEEEFAWPPRDDGQVAAFESSMSAGLGPVVETFRRHADRLWAGPGETRLLDVGGGDGTLAAYLVGEVPGLRADVYNLPAVRPLVEATRRRSGCGRRLQFVAGDFLREPLPAGYDALSFVRVLYDWPAATARHLLAAAHRALPAGGRVLICEEFRTSERLAGQFFWSYFLIGVDSCASQLREVTYYLRLLREIGFDRVEVLPGPFELVTAVRP